MRFNFTSMFQKFTLLLVFMLCLISVASAEGIVGCDGKYICYSQYDGWSNNREESIRCKPQPGESWSSVNVDYENKELSLSDINFDVGGIVEIVTNGVENEHIFES